MRMGLPKGRLFDGVLGTLAGSGLKFQFDNARDYKPSSSDDQIAAKLFKARAIPQLLALGNIDIGFTGLDLVTETGYENVVDLLDLGLNKVELVVAVHRDQQNILSDPPKRPLLIATEYENLADRWALERGLAHITIQTHGSTEAYLPDDADIIFDCTETGKTLDANDLVAIDSILVSTTHAFANRESLKQQETGLQIKELLDELKGLSDEIPEL